VPLLLNWTRFCFWETLLGDDDRGALEELFHAETVAVADNLLHEHLEVLKTFLSALPVYVPNNNP